MGKWKSLVQMVVACASMWMMVYAVLGPRAFGIRDPDEVDENYERDLSTEEDIMKLGQVLPESKTRQCKCPKREAAPAEQAVVERSVESREVPVRIFQSAKDYPDPKSVIKILSWTQLWGSSTGPWYEEGSAIFDKCHFDIPLACEYTHDRSKYDEADAVLFHSFFINDLPEYRYPDQKWVFWEYESPRIVMVRQNLTDYRHLFNITSTYSKISDVPLPFLRKCVPVPGEYNVQGAPTKNYAKGKLRKVAWFVSHCQTPSKRELYVKELQKHIPVDIYGECGPHKCPQENKNFCFKEVLEKHYKFYLAFENSLCRDYVTEKLWNIFDNHLNIIPVVLGEADYTNMLPRGTYIDVQDFKSPTHLAAYLKHLDSNDKEYNQYILRRTFHTCRYTTPYRHYHCGLCEHLHRHRGRTEVALDISREWSVQRRCKTARAFYNTAAPGLLDKEDTQAKEWSLS